MKRLKFGGVKLLLIVAATFILVAQVSAAPVHVEMSDSDARDQIIKHEQYVAHYNNAIQTPESVQSHSVDAVNNAARERNAVQNMEQAGGDENNEYQNSEAVTLRERLHAINEKLSNGDLTDEEIAEFRRIRYELELKLNELMDITDDDTVNADETDDVSEIATIRERIRAVNAMLEEGGLTDNEIAELRRMRYELELKLNELMDITNDDTYNSGDTDDILQNTAIIRERILAIDEMLDEGDLTDDEIAELRRMRYELELKLNELMNDESDNKNNSNGSQDQNGSTGEKNNRSDMVGSIREIIRSFFGF